MSYRILFIEDNSLVSNVLVDRLSGKGFYVKQTDDGDKALGMVDKGAFDLVVLDLQLTGTDGLKLLKEIREHYSDIGVLIYTGEANFKAAIDALRYGADDFLVKDKDLEEVIPRVQRILEKTELKKAYLRLQQKYRNLVEDLSDAIGSTDRDGYITYVSPSITRILGYTPEEMIGRSYRDFVHPEDLELAEHTEADGFNGKALTNVNRLMHKNGNVVWVRFSAYPKKGEHGVEAVHTVLTDITETKDLQEKLIHQERLAAIGELAAFVAHDINTPLQGIYSIVDYLKKRETRDTDLMEKLNLTYNALNRIRSTVEILLGMENTATPEVTEINRSVVKVFKLAECYLRAHGVRYALDLSEGLPALKTPQKEFEYYLIELIRWIIRHCLGRTAERSSEHVSETYMPGTRLFGTDEDTMGASSGNADESGPFSDTELVISTREKDERVIVSFNCSDIILKNGGRKQLPLLSEVLRTCGGTIEERISAGDVYVLILSFPATESVSIDMPNR